MTKFHKVKNEYICTVFSAATATATTTTIYRVLIHYWIVDKVVSGPAMHIIIGRGWY